MAPQVSIVVNCYNQAHCLERAVQSVLQQTFTDLECLIVDDGSTDATPDIAAQLMAQDNRVQYYPKPNGGLPAARNYGVKLAQGEWIQCLDADDWIAPEKTEFQLNWLMQHDSALESVPDRVVLYSDYQRVYLNPDESIAERQDYQIGALTTDAFIRRMLTPDFLTPTAHPALQQAMLMHRSALANVTFPEHLKALGDRFFGVDLLAQGVQFIYTPIIGAFYTKHRQNRTNNWHYMRNYYIEFYETVRSRYPDFMPWCHDGVSFLMDEAIRERQPETVKRLQAIAAYPLHVRNGTVKLPNPLALQAFQAFSRRVPRWVLYPQCRGPRSQKLFALFSR